MNLRNRLFGGVSYFALSITFVQRYAAAIIADGIRNRGRVKQ